MGFCVAEIEGNEDCRFGMVGDVLLQTAVSWLRSKGIREIYLESGKDNRNAHRFFEKRGFIHVSEMYKLTQ
jgi:N-acetylglutamate synthase-like GNAT family acetyltransferase